MGDGLLNSLPIIGAATDVLGAVGQHFQNVKNRKFAREMYKRQRTDALSDWEMQNEYNSPRSQMQRFQEAGLNRNLIYGQTNEGATIRSSTASAVEGRAPNISSDGFRSGAMAYADLGIKSAQQDLLAKRLQLMDEDILKRKADTIATLTGIDKSKLDIQRGSVALALETALKDYQVTAADLQNRKTGAEIGRIGAETQFQLSENERREAMNAVSISEAVERIAKMKKEELEIQARTAKIGDERDMIRKAIEEIDYKIMNMRKDGVLKDFDIKAGQMGMLKGQPGWFNVVEKLTSEFRKIRDRVVKPSFNPQPRGRGGQ